MTFPLSHDFYFISISRNPPRHCGSLRNPISFGQTPGICCGSDLAGKPMPFPPFSVMSHAAAVAKGMANLPQFCWPETYWGFELVFSGEGVTSSCTMA